VNLAGTTTSYDQTYVTPFVTNSGFDQAQTGTIDASLIDAADYSDGFLPAGYPVALYTSGVNVGKLGKYDDAGATGLDVCVGVTIYNYAIDSATDLISVAYSGHLLHIDNAKMVNPLTADAIADLKTSKIV